MVNWHLLALSNTISMPSFHKSLFKLHIWNSARDDRDVGCFDQGMEMLYITYNFDKTIDLLFLKKLNYMINKNLQQNRQNNYQAVHV